jgi:hypothetical protein
MAEKVRERKSRKVVFSGAGRKRVSSHKNGRPKKPAPKTPGGQLGPTTKIGIRSVKLNGSELTVTLTGRRPLKDDPNKVKLMCSSEEHAQALKTFIEPTFLHKRDGDLPCYQERFARTQTRQGAVYRLKRLAESQEELTSRIREAARKKEIRDKIRDEKRAQKEKEAARLAAFHNTRR